MVQEIKHLLLIAEYGTFTAAARRAHLSQPALTASIRRLERDIGARLLHRGRGGAELTAAGHAFVPRARAALAAIEEGRRAVAEIEGLGAGEVRLGAGATVCTYLLPKTLARYRKSFPNVRISLIEGYRERLEDEVQAGRIDLAIVTGGGDELWRRDELIIVGAPKLDARRAGFVTFGEGSATRALLRKHFGEVDIVMELSGIAAVKSNVRAGIGKALLSRAAVEADVKTGRLVVIGTRNTPIRRKLSLVHRGVDRLTPSAAALRKMLLAGKKRR